jgi:hypothetical protein
MTKFLNQILVLTTLMVLSLSTLYIDTIAQVQPGVKNAYFADYDQAYFDKAFAANMLTLAMIGTGKCSVVFKNCIFPVNNPNKKPLIIEIAAKLTIPGLGLVASNACIYYPIRGELDCQFDIMTGPLDELPPIGTVDLYYRDARYPVANAVEKKGIATLQLSLGNLNGYNSTKTEQNGVFKPSTFAVTGQKTRLVPLLEAAKYGSNDNFKLQLINKANNTTISIPVTKTVISTPLANFIQLDTEFQAPVAGWYRKSVCKVVGTNCEPQEMSNADRHTFQVLAKKPTLLPLTSKSQTQINSDRLNVVVMCTEDHYNNSIEECRSKMEKNLAFDSLPYKLDKFGLETADETKVGALAYGLFAIEPYKFNRSKFNFWYVNDILSLDDMDDSDWLNGVENGNIITLNMSQMIIQSKSPPSLTPNAYTGLVEPIITNKKFSFRRIIMNPSFDLRIGTFTLSHEFSHSFAGLGDEYPEFMKLVDLDKARYNPINCAYNMDDAVIKWGDKIGLVDPFAIEWLGNLNKYPSAKAVFSKARNIDLTNTNFIKVGYEKAIGNTNNGCKADKEMIRPTKFSNMRGYLDGIEPFGSVNRAQIEGSLNLFTSQPTTICNNGRMLSECSKLPASVNVCPQVVTNFKVYPSDYDTKTGYCKNSLIHPTLGTINFGNFPKSIIDECKRITPLANAKECTGTLDTDVFGTKVQTPYLTNAKLVQIKAKQLDKCLTSNKQMPPIGVLYKSGCFEEIKNADGTISKNVYAVFNSNVINECIIKFPGTICYTGKLPLDKFLSLLTKQTDKDAMIKYGIK